HLSVIQYLVQNGANIDGDAQSVSPLECAAENGHLSVVQYLVRNGADINGRGRWFCSPLACAAQNGHLSV
ncbi:hypothetical protein AOQ84DRAFT_276912, partial [Glonium stellatum]